MTVNHQTPAKAEARIILELTDDQREQMAIAQKMQREADEIRAEVERQVRNDPKVDLARNLAQGMKGSPPRIVLGLKQAQVFYSVMHHVDGPPPPTHQRQSIFMDPKTTNLLLNGKLITAVEKRALLRALYPGLKEAIGEAYPEPLTVSISQPKISEGMVSAAINGDFTPKDMEGGDGLRGKIEVGQRFVWEPGNTHAQMLIEVVDITQPEGDERRIHTREVIKGEATGPKVWNDESRFREACIRLGGEIS